MRLRLLAAPAVLVALALAAPAAFAGTLLNRTVSTSDTEKRRCHARLAPAGTDGVVRRTVRVTTSSLIRARLTAPRGDWDLGVFDRHTRRSIGGSAAFGSRELAEGYAAPGAVIVQA
nr:hypothetical protein [Solirubrobacterales bacterium]